MLEFCNVTLFGLEVQILPELSSLKISFFYEKSQKRVKSWSLPMSNSCIVILEHNASIYNIKIVRSTILLVSVSLFPNFCHLGPVCVRPFVCPFVCPSVTSFSRDWLISFCWFLAQRCKMAMPKMWWSPQFSEKNSFPVENARNMLEKPVFWHFLEISPLVLSDSLHKDAY